MHIIQVVGWSEGGAKVFLQVVVVVMSTYSEVFSMHLRIPSLQRKGLAEVERSKEGSGSNSKI